MEESTRPKDVTTSTKGPATLEGMVQPAVQSRMSTLDLGLKRVRLDKKVTVKKKAKAAENFFLLYMNLLSEDAHFQWDKIVSSQVDTAPWTDVRGIEQPDARTKSYMSFMDCVMLHL